jgi:hypothetical protein
MQYSQVKSLFRSLNEVVKTIKQVKKPSEDIIQKMLDYGQLRMVEFKGGYNKKQKLYIYKLKADNYLETTGKSKSFVESRAIAYDNMLFNIDNNLRYCFINSNSSNMKEYDNLHDKLNNALQNSKATKDEIEDELCQEADCERYKTKWDCYDDNVKIDDLNAELDHYWKSVNPGHLSFDYKKNEELLEKLQVDGVPIVRPSPPVFGKSYKMEGIKPNKDGDTNGYWENCDKCKNGNNYWGFCGDCVWTKTTE